MGRERYTFLRFISSKTVLYVIFLFDIMFLYKHIEINSCKSLKTHRFIERATQTKLIVNGQKNYRICINHMESSIVTEQRSIILLKGHGVNVCRNIQNLDK